jgi:hypothetical protein
MITDLFLNSVPFFDALHRFVANVTDLLTAVL